MATETFQKGSKRAALGGAINVEDLEEVEYDTGVEISKGQSPTLTFAIPNVKIPFHHICKVPGSTRLLGTLYESVGFKLGSSCGIHGFDVTQPESGATIIGLGLGMSVNDLVAHEVSPVLRFLADLSAI